MPELPDVEIFKRYVDATSLQQKIEEVHVRDTQILDDTTPQVLGKWLHRRRFIATRRHGKHLFLELDNHRWLGVHFGMTGAFQYYKLEDREPEYAQAVIDFNNGYHLAYTLPRKLGRLRLLENPAEFIAEKELGPDALELNRAVFLDLLDGRRGMIKSALMDQSLLAGIGNEYSDEILFHAGVYPRADISGLDDEIRNTLFETMRQVLTTAIECQVDPEQLPEDYLLPRREPGAQCPGCDGEIETIEVGGRTGYYCPVCQTNGK